MGFGSKGFQGGRGSSGFGGARGGLAPLSDTDAQAFVTAANISNPTQRSAVNTLVIALKAASIWTKMQAIYPFVGGTAASHKWNLKDPRDLDAAFRLSFTGGWTHSATGAKPDGATAYADTHYVVATNGVNNSTHYTYYSRTSSSSGMDMGVETATGRAEMGASFSVVGGDYYSNVYDPSGVNTILVAVTDSLGLFTVSRTSSALDLAYRNATNISGEASASAGFAGANISTFIGAVNVSGTPTYFSNHEGGWASIGTGLSATDVSNLNTAVQAYETSLGRSV